MNIISRRTTAAFAATAAILLAAGCSSDTGTPPPAQGDGDFPRIGLEDRDATHIPDDWGDVEQAAIEEGSVVVYTTTPAEQFDPVAAAFNEIYPEIKVERVSDALSTLAVRYEQERSAGTNPADILSSSSFESVIEAHQDWFINIAEEGPDMLPNLADFSELAIPEDRPYSVTQGAYTFQIAYNTDMVDESDLPETYEDLADPKWGGKLGIVDPRASDTYAAVLEALRAAYGDEYLEALTANGYSLTKESSDTAQQVAAGAIALGFPTNASKSESFIDSGAPLKLLDVPIYPIGATTMALPTEAPHPNAARLFANFLLTAQAQEMQCELVKVGSLNELAGGDCSKYTVPADATPLDYSLTSDVREHIFALMGVD